MSWIAVGIAAAGTLMAYSGQRGAGRAEARRGRELAQLGEMEAQQLEQQAGQSIAASQRTAMEEQRNARLAESRALAVAAASGGGASDPTVSKIIADLAGEGAYRSSVALYEGEERARQMRFGAKTRRFEGQMALEGGRAAQRAYNIGAYASLFTGAGRILSSPTLVQKYGGTGAPTTTGRPAGSYEDAGTPGLYPYA